MGLRTKLIRLAHALPAGSAERHAVLQLVGDCKKQFSMGWIDPTGKLVEMPGMMTHNQWAGQWLDRHGDPRPQPDPMNPTGEENSKVLMGNGWVKASSYYVFEIGMQASRKAMKGAARVCTDCCRAKRTNPEDLDVQVWNQLGRVTRMDALRFIERYGGASMAGELFRLVSRVGHEDARSRGQEPTHPA